MTHWRHRSRDGMVYIQDAQGDWHWVTPAHTRRSMHRLACVIVGTVSALLLSALVLIALVASTMRARADGLPQYGITCADIVLMQKKFGIVNTTKGRIQARAIAAALGVWISEEEMEEAARCLPPATKEKR